MGSIGDREDLVGPAVRVASLAGSFMTKSDLRLMVGLHHPNSIHRPEIIRVIIH